MQETQKTRMPTGIASLEPILDGGILPGTISLLLGEIGAGYYEFAYGSIVNLLGCLKRPREAENRCPTKILCITFTRLEADIHHEIVQSFHVDGVTEDATDIRFEDLSDLYFDRSIEPDSQFSQSNILTRLQKRAEHENIFMNLIQIFNNAKPGIMIILDSITDIATQSALPNLWSDLTGFLKLQRLSKSKNFISYLLLSKGIIDAAKESEIYDIVDAVFMFRLEESAGSRRQRFMSFEKFRRIMPHFEAQNLVNFAVMISTNGGFEVNNIRMVI